MKNNQSNMQKDLQDVAREMLKERYPAMRRLPPDSPLWHLPARKVAEILRKMPMAEQIRLLAMRRSLRLAGAVPDARRGLTYGGGGTQNVADGFLVAKAYMDYINDPANQSNAAAQLKHVIESFDYGTPDDGSVFWTGIDKNKLVKQIGIWNRTLGGQLFGQLEATTDARFVDGVFAYDEIGRKYWGGVSEQMGKAVKGHVTAVQLYALQQRADAIFTHKELPAVLEKMAAQLARNEAPDVTDITIVVLEPVKSVAESRVFTNLEIGNIPLCVNSRDPSLRLVGRAPGQFTVVEPFDRFIPAIVKKYWRERRQKTPVSRAASQILMDARRLKYS